MSGITSLVSATLIIGIRHAQTERAELVFIAHQLDLLGRTDGCPGTAGAPV